MDNIEKILENLEDLGHDSISFYELDDKPLDFSKGAGLIIGESYFIKHDFKMIIGNTYYIKRCRFKVMSECNSEFGNYIVKIIDKNVDIISLNNNSVYNNEEYIDNAFCDNTIHRFIHENFNDIVPLGQLHPENRPEMEPIIGTELDFTLSHPYRCVNGKLLFRSVSKYFRFGKYIVKQINYKGRNSRIGKCIIVREITKFEKFILVFKKHYKDIFKGIFYPPSKHTRKWSENSFLSLWYTGATYGTAMMMKIRIENDMY
jgi:hypothetical protein